MNRLQANICLICVTVAWSTEVVIFACIPDGVVPFATTCITYLAGSFLIFGSFFERIAKELAREGRRLLSRCALLGVLNCTYNVMFIYGLKYFDVSTGAFTLSLTVVAIPVIFLVTKRSVDRKTWMSSAFITAGILSAFMGNFRGEQLPGLAIILAGCFLRAFYIIRVADYTKENDPISLAALTTGFVGIISFVMWTAVQPATFMAMTWSPVIIASLAIYSYFVVAFAIILNNFAQRRTTAANAAIIYSLEIVFSVLWGLVLPGSLIDQTVLTPGIVIGVCLIVSGNIIEIVEFKGVRKKQAH